MNKWQEELKKKPEYNRWYIEELSIKDKTIYSSYIKKTAYPVNVWASNFDYLWALSQSGNLTLYKALVHHILVTFALTNKGRLYLPCLPFGKATRSELVHVLLTVSSFCFQWNKKSQYTHKSIINPINECQLNYLEKNQYFRHYFKSDKLTGLERHYSISKIVALKGKDFSHIRNKINRFKRDYPQAIIRDYHPRDFNDVMKLGQYWETESGIKYRRIIDGFYFEKIVKNYQALDHIIIVVELNHKIIGMTSGGLLPTGEAWGCLSKFDKEYKGLSETLAVEMAKKVHEVNPSAKYMNVGSDLGTKGLAFFKERFRPVFNYKRYALHFKPQ